MADLDNFFAKKDRKKSKSIKKFATADEFAKKLEDTKQKSDVRPKKERPVQEGEESNNAREEEEWKEYEEPVKDYTGLKIHVLQGGNGQSESGRDQVTEDSVPDNGKVKGPWNKPVETPPVAAVVVEEKPREAPARTQTYVPPSSRARPEPVRRVVSKNAPDIHNADNFPVLGGGGGGGGAVLGKRGGGGGGWSAAAGGGGGGAAPRARHPLALDNRFTSLQDDS